jgi:hypothetical protein
MPDWMATFLSKAQKGSHTIVSDGVPVAKPTKNNKTIRHGQKRTKLLSNFKPNITWMGLELVIQNNRVSNMPLH